MATALVSRVETWARDQAARLPAWARPPPSVSLPRWPWPWSWPPPPRAPAWPGDRRRQRERMFREEFERRRRQLRELCRAVRVDTVAELQELLCAVVLAECVYKRPVSEMMRYINKFKSDFGGNIVSLERVQPSLDHVTHRYLLAESGDTLFATFIGTKQYKDIIADVNILQGTVFHEDTAQKLADAVESVQNDDQNGEENLGTSYREKSKQLRKSKPAAHRGFLARAKGIPALELYKLAQKKNRKLVLCGHSLGGAVAALSTLAILRVLASSSLSKEPNRLQVKCITFSQPPVGNAALRDYVHRRGWQDYFKSYCIPEDLVPRILSPAYFHHYNTQTPEPSFANNTNVKSDEKETKSMRPKDNNGEQLVLGVGPVQKSLWRLSKLVPLEGVRKSLSALQKQTNIFGKAPAQLDSFLQSKVDESEEGLQSLEIQEGSEGIALTPLSDKDGLTEEDDRSEKKNNVSEVGGSKRWNRPYLPSYIPFGEVQSVITELRERLQSHSMKSYRARFQKIYDMCMCANAPLFAGIEQLPQFSHLQELLGLTAADSVELGHIVEPPTIRTATSILPLGWNGCPGGKGAEPLKVDIIGHDLHMCTLFQAQINGNWYSTVIETLPMASYSSHQEAQPALQKMRILVGHPLKQPPNYTSEDFMVPVATGTESNPDYGFDSLFEDKGCCKGLNEFLLYGTSDFVTICKEVYVRTRRVRLLGLEGAGKTSLLKALLGQFKERSKAVLECIHVDLHGKGVSNGLCYLDSTTVNLQELPLEVRQFKEELQLGIHDLSRKTDLIIVVHNLAHRIPQYHQSNASQPQPALSLLLDEAKALGIPWILAITNKFSVSAHEQNTLISSAMEAYQASPDMTKVVNSSPFLMQNARNSLRPISSVSGTLRNEDPSDRTSFYPVNFALSPFQRKDIVMHVEGVTALRQLVHQVIRSNEEPAFEELACERLSLELEREKAASLQAKQKPQKRDGSVTAAAVGASLGAGLGIVMAVIMGAASALRKP
uniref:Fungal lipase-type domain-containing protein n=1 Tax=Leersia perrieri TaxID=77586 RepID=A0A0D9VG12_9ORYZ